MIALFLFYNKTNGFQSIFSTKGIKHCNIICYDGQDFIMFALEEHGIGFRRIKAKSTLKIMRNIKVIETLIGMIVVNVDEPKKIPWKPFWVRSCNELCRYVSGVDIGFTFNPTHLINKLLKYNNKRNYQILSSWSRDNGIL